jgi:hypothetical protein
MGTYRKYDGIDSRNLFDFAWRIRGKDMLIKTKRAK